MRSAGTRKRTNWRCANRTPRIPPSQLLRWTGRRTATAEDGGRKASGRRLGNPVIAARTARWYRRESKRDSARSPATMPALWHSLPTQIGQAQTPALHLSGARGRGAHQQSCGACPPHCCAMTQDLFRQSQRPSQGELATSRLLTITETGEIQGLNVLVYLSAAITAHRSRKPASFVVAITHLNCYVTTRNSMI